MVKKNNRGHNASSEGFISRRIAVSPATPESLTLTATEDFTTVAVETRQDMESLMMMQETLQEKLAAVSPDWVLPGKEGVDAIHRKKLMQAIFEDDSPVLAEVLAEMEPLDTAQRVNLVSKNIGRVLYRMEKEGIDPQAQADREEWAAWCAGEAERVAMTDPLLALEYERMGAGVPLSAVEFAVYKDLRLQIGEAKVSLDREIRYLAAYRDISYEDAVAAFQMAREEFYAAEADQPEIPAWYDKALSYSYLYGKKRTKPPLDKGTEYALYAVLTDERRTASYPRLQRGYVVFDTETTSAEADASIVQLTAIAYDYHGKETGRINTYVNPGRDADGKPIESDAEAAAVHHITAEVVKDAPSFAELAPQLQAMMRGDGNGDGPVLVAHNLLFDYTKIDRDLKAAGQPGLQGSIVTDTLFLARCAQPNPGVPNSEHRHTLQAACGREGIEFNPEEAHDASYDVSRTALLFTALRKKF